MFILSSPELYVFTNQICPWSESLKRCPVKPFVIAFAINLPLYNIHTFGWTTVLRTFPKNLKTSIPWRGTPPSDCCFSYDSSTLSKESNCFLTLVSTCLLKIGFGFNLSRRVKDSWLVRNYFVSLPSKRKKNTIFCGLAPILLTV